MRHIVVIAHNLRSTHNIGSLLRTAEGLGVDKVVLSGYTPYPAIVNDTRLPHEAHKLDTQIAKTALGAEKTQAWEHTTDITQAINDLKGQGFTVAALEQTADSIKLPSYKCPERVAIIVGREVEGLEQEVLNLCDVALEIPMFGQKESFNVVQAAAMTMYHCRFV
jgi:23S rRNA (guanosine2251-2'-O)-methyltransferase